MATKRLDHTHQHQAFSGKSANDRSPGPADTANTGPSVPTSTFLKRTLEAQGATASAPAASTGNYRVIFPSREACNQRPSPPFQPRYLIPPQSDPAARAVLMGNAISEAPQATNRYQKNPMMNNTANYPEGMPRRQPPTPRSNLSALLEGSQPPPQQQHQQQQTNARIATPRPVHVSQEVDCNSDQASSSPSSNSKHGEADSASGPAPTPPSPGPSAQLGRSAPTVVTAMPSNRRRYSSGTTMGTPPLALHKECVCGAEDAAVAYDLQQQAQQASSIVTNADASGHNVRRCMSSKELGMLAPPSGSPYVAMLSQRELLENEMTEKWSEKRDCLALEATPSTSPVPDKAPIHSQHLISGSSNDVSTSSSQQSGSTGTAARKAGANENRNRRRAAHNRAVVEELCEIVADLFIAESKLIKPSNYGVSRSLERAHVLKSVQKFVAALPTRYALGADTPSEVLLHMRLMAVARSDPAKCVVHIINLDNDSYWTGDGVHGSKGAQRNLRLVTIACSDAVGLLEYITKLLGTGGSRVLDADVMLSSDGIVLDRFVVEMNGRLRLDKLANLIEAFLKKARTKVEHDRDHQEDCSCQDSSQGTQSAIASGPLYFNPPKHQSSNNLVRRDVQEEIQAAVPLTEVLASPNANDAKLDPHFQTLKRHFSMPNELACRSMREQHLPNPGIFTPNLSSSQRSQQARTQPANAVNLLPRPAEPSLEAAVDPALNGITVEPLPDGQSMRQKRPLVNRRGSSDLDRIGMEGESESVADYVTVPSEEGHHGRLVEARVVPLIPFDELMLIETIGMGRVSTIYRAAWQNPMGVQMVALKVAMVNPETRDMSHVDELRREADIAARIKHPNVCELVGVAADAECFCLAYDFCEGGSVFSLLSDTSRYYEYLPIALDVANGMAHLHSRDIIHRDLKPSNILLTRDQRAKIADFGMSVANVGQELTAETGTYRYMAPEVIRHESYSSNADVYSFGVFLWQLITRQVPFASMTPVQAAYAVAEGRRPEIPPSTPPRLKEIIEACWNQDSHQRPSFTYIAMALADYAKLSFSPASVGAQTLQIANDMLATVEGNSNINVDFTAPVPDPYILNHDDNVGLEI